jgi:hypothetical protein
MLQREVQNLRRQLDQAEGMSRWALLYSSLINHLLGDGLRFSCYHSQFAVQCSPHQSWIISASLYYISCVDIKLLLRSILLTPWFPFTDPCFRILSSFSVPCKILQNLLIAWHRKYTRCGLIPPFAWCFLCDFLFSNCVHVVSLPPLCMQTNWVTPVCSTNLCVRRWMPCCWMCRACKPLPNLYHQVSSNTPFVPETILENSASDPPKVPLLLAAWVWFISN